MTVSIESNTILEVTDDEVATHLLINVKYIVIVAEPAPPIQNTPHSTSLVLCETIVIFSQYNTKKATGHYF